MLVLTLVLTVILGGYSICFGAESLRRLTAQRLSWWWAAPLAAAVQALGIFGSQFRPAASGIALVLIAGFCVANWRHLGLLIAGIGAALNLVAMLANGGQMPVAPELVLQSHGFAAVEGQPVLFSKNIALGDDQAMFALLGDRFLLPGPLQHLAIWSLGDFILIAGVALYLYTVMRGTATYDELRSATLQ